MPRKYNPVGYLDWEYGCDVPFAEARMDESPNGEWVKLKTFEDTTAMLIKANQRQQHELSILRAQLFELTNKPEGTNYA
jgi:hypothetical protein